MLYPKWSDCVWSFPNAVSLDILLFLQNSKATEFIGLSLVSEEALAEPKFSEDKLKKLIPKTCRKYTSNEV